MRLFKKFFEDVKKYRVYILLSSRSELKVQVADTFFGYLWWILDPFLNMLIYTLLVTFILQRDMENFAVFAFCALLPWKWLTTTLTSSTDCIRRKSSVLQQVYLPKMILPLIKLIVNFVKFICGFIVIIILLLFFNIRITFHFFEVAFVVITNGAFIYGLSLILAHYGVFVTDTKNLIAHIIKLWFYVSPGIYAVDRIPEQYRIFWWLNPMTTIFASYRNVFMFGKSPLYLPLMIWFVISIILIYIGLRCFDKYDKNYSKVI